MIYVTPEPCVGQCWTDQRLIISKLNLKIQPKRRRQGTKQQKKLNVESLALAEMKKKLASEISFALDSPNHPPEYKLKTFGKT